MGKVRECPVQSCGAMNKDEGHYLSKCKNFDVCGYCRHASLTGGVCDQCGATADEYFSIDKSKSAAQECLHPSITDGVCDDCGDEEL